MLTGAEVQQVLPAVDVLSLLHLFNYYYLFITLTATSVSSSNF